MLDRDGVINKDVGLLRNPKQWEWCAGAPEAMSALVDAGYKLAICSNQPGITSSEYYEVMSAARQRYFWDFYGVPSLRTRIFPMCFVCRHSLTTDCECRKPKLELWSEIEKGYTRIDLANSWVVEAVFENLDFGRQVGMNLAWITRDEDDVREPLDYDVFGSLHHFAETLLKKKIAWTALPALSGQPRPPRPSPP